MTRTHFTPAAICAVVLLLAAPPGLAEPLVDEPGLLEIGTIDPWESRESGEGGRSSSSSSSTSTDTRECVIPSPFGGCLFELEEHTESSDEDEDVAWSYYYAAENSTMSGYYANVLGGVVFTRVASGEESSEAGEGSRGSFLDSSRTYYENNLGYSEEHIDDTRWSWDEASAQERRVARTTAEAGVAAPVAGVDVDATRETGGREAASAEGASSGSNRTYDEYFGVPLYEERDAQSSAFSQASERFWNQTVASASIYLVNPVDASRVDIVALRLHKGDESGAGDQSGSSSSSESTSVFGFTLYEREDSAGGSGEYAFFEEWLRLSVDLVDGTVEGDVAYDHGDDAGTTDERERTSTGVGGIPLYGEEHVDQREASSEWRDLTFRIDAADGEGVLTLGAWDDSSQSARTWEETYEIVGIPVGAAGEEESRAHTDGVGFGLDTGSGLLWLGARYENRSREERSTTDLTLDRDPLAGLSHEESEAVRGVYLGAGSELLGVSAGARQENRSESSRDGVRLGGEELGALSHEDERTEYAAGADARGIFVFEMRYADGRSDDAIVLAGTPMGVRDDYQRLDASARGDVRSPADGAHVFSYSFEHAESSDDYDLYADDADIGGLRHNATRDAASIVVLDGLAHARAEREFSNDQVFAGEDTEVAELGLQQLGVEAGHGAVGAGDAGAEEGSASASVFLAYVEAADAIAVVAGLATWCVAPGVALPYDEVVGTLPPEVAALAGTGIGLVAMALCFGAPVLVPLFLASPCIVVPLAGGTVFVTAGAATSLLPVGGDVAALLAGTAEGAFWATYEEQVGCVWLTIPDAVRNPQPGVWALEPVAPVVDGGLAQVWAGYDAARVTAYSVMDAAFRADAGLPPVGTLPPPPEEPPAPPPFP